MPLFLVLLRMLCWTLFAKVGEKAGKTLQRIRRAYNYTLRPLYHKLPGGGTGATFYFFRSVLYLRQKRTGRVGKSRRRGSPPFLDGW